MIGSCGRGAGKTQLACAILEQFGKQESIIGIKVTTITKRDGSCPRGEKGCGVCSSLKGDFLITSEQHAPPDKDTARLARSGASQVFWLRVMKNSLEDGFNALLDQINSKSPVLCESNSLRTVVEPGLFLLVKDGSDEPVKSSASAVEQYADRLINSDNGRLDINLPDITFMDGRWGLRECANAIILAGGQSSRMKQDKNTLSISGRPMIEHIRDQLRPNFSDIIISANEQQDLKFLNSRVVIDKAQDRGPLMGIACGLEESESDINLITACDHPDIDMALARRMIRAAHDYDIVVPRYNGVLEPLFGVYRKSALNPAKDLLDTGQYRVRELFTRCHTLYMDIDTTPPPSNINTPAEYEEYVTTTSRKQKP